ncbi:unnamed protein product [Ceutorhynchus assimilis]|uniref:Venom dipeptidyl peptidase 4 n=1 Tax=Ceutorhynchus assimilis TaxID=467358 RepID=A0A9N9MSZ8_9CUCU|nr:unnamed protein product [Ceutorhynchus assimilis]
MSFSLIIKFSVCLIGLCFLVNSTKARTITKESTIEEGKTAFTLKECLDGTFKASGWNGTWLTESSFLFKNSDGDYYSFDVTTKNAELFLQGSILDDYREASITISPDQSYVLIRYNVSSVFRHSTTAIYAVYDIGNKKYYDVNNKIAVQLATFDTTGHGFAYVYLNNIYYLPSVLETENPIKVTEDGIEGVIYNGAPDWVYEEEVLGTGSALWFSPDGKHLAYVKFNDTAVKEFTYFLYGTPGVLASQYPLEAKIKYPKVGTPNPVVQTYVYNIATGNTISFKLIDSIKNTEEDNDYVLYDLTWLSESEVAIISTNRIQNESVLIRCDLSGSCNEEVSRKQKNGWLLPQIPKYNKNATNRLEILPQEHDGDYFNHLVLAESRTNIAKRLTFGNRVITHVYGWDQTNNLVYYASSVNNTPSQQHISVVNTATLEDKCLTCEFQVDGELCKYAGASFSSNFQYYVKVCQGPNPAYVLIENLNNETDVYVWNDNSQIRQALSKKARPVKRDLLVPLDGGNFTARVRLWLPPDFDENRTYPAVVNVYAGPNSNQITDVFSSGVMNYFVANRSYIYIYIDGRGSGRDGEKKMFQIYRKMGTVEIEDQIAVTKYLQDNLSYIDRHRTGIWGWSYGGFASTWTLVKDKENVFKFALAVAPVTSFIYYDTIYTERYMGLPTEDDNLYGYNNTDINRHVEALRGKLYFIIHGNADDNVHYQQAMVLIKALEAADIPFMQQSYPDENHSLNGVTKHLYQTIDRFWARAFEVEGPPLKVW